jgi:hypothetical protein
MPNDQEASHGVTTNEALWMRLCKNTKNIRLIQDDFLSAGFKTSFEPEEEFFSL